MNTGWNHTRCQALRAQGLSIFIYTSIVGRQGPYSDKCPPSQTMKIYEVKTSQRKRQCEEIKSQHVLSEHPCPQKHFDRKQFLLDPEIYELYSAQSDVPPIIRNLPYPSQLQELPFHKSQLEVVSQISSGPNSFQILDAAPLLYPDRS